MRQTYYLFHDFYREIQILESFSYSNLQIIIQPRLLDIQLKPHTLNDIGCFN